MAFFRTVVILGLACLPMAAAPVEPVAPAGHRPAVRVPFPPISDWSTLQIRLVRTPCFGRCPAYSVEIRGDGTVVYQGEHFVEVPGLHVARVPEAVVRRLFDAFVKADFFWTFDKYRGPVTDFPTTIVSISFDGRNKTVLDYAGETEGLPKAVADLEDAIDLAGGTKRWTGS